MITKTKIKVFVTKVPSFNILSFKILTIALLTAPFAFAEDCNLKDLDPIALDKNKNGAISRDEADGSLLAWVFNKVDANSNGLIDSSEFMNRCNAVATKTAQAEVKKDAEPGAVEAAVVEKADRQVDRAGAQAESRVDKETDEAVDKAVNKGLDRLFGK